MTIKMKLKLISENYDLVYNIFTEWKYILKISAVVVILSIHWKILSHFSILLQGSRVKGTNTSRFHTIPT